MIRRRIEYVLDRSELYIEAIQAMLELIAEQRKPTEDVCIASPWCDLLCGWCQILLVHLMKEHAADVHSRLRLCEFELSFQNMLKTIRNASLQGSPKIVVRMTT